MKYSYIIIGITLSIIISSCSSNNTEDSNEKDINDNVKVSYIHQDDQTFDAIKKQGAIIAKQTQVELGTALKNAILKGGHEYAVNFCNLEALTITDSMATNKDVIIRRLAKKNRNPENAMDEVESKIFKQYVMEYLQAKPMKPRIAINGEGHPVYYKPIITNDMCLSCHGKPGETMSTGLAEKIKEQYPDDKAINFDSGHPRGMWAITFTKLNINPNK